MLREHDRLVGQQARGEDRQGAVLVPGGADAPAERAAPLDHERLHGSLTGDGGRQGAAIVPAALEPTREQAWETLTRYTKSEALLRHALAVEASTAFYARKFGEDEELWRVTALLHDFDYEMHPTLDQHPQDGAPILRELGYPEERDRGACSRTPSTSRMPRDTPLKKTLFACDELSGFVHACGLVRPTGLDGLEPKSVRKKLKQPSFAAGVHRDEVYAGAELLGLELDEHIANVISALQPIGPELGLRTADAPSCSASRTGGPCGLSSGRADLDLDRCVIARERFLYVRSSSVQSAHRGRRRSAQEDIVDPVAAAVQRDSAGGGEQLLDESRSGRW